MSKRVLLCVLIIAALIAGCTPQQTAVPQTDRTPEATVAPTPTAAAEATTTAPHPTPVRSSTYRLSRPMGVAAFATNKPYKTEVQPAVAAYSTTLGDLGNPEVAQGLSQEQQASLEENGFVVAPEGPQQIYQLYKNAQEQGIPIFVTTDAMLHAFHVLYDYCLRHAEKEYFLTDIQALNQVLLDESQFQYNEASGETKEAAKRNWAYFTVAARLLDPSAPIADEIKELVEGELALIEAHSGFAPSPIFGYDEDYSQYVPRGHYTRNEDFERYFRAMMWYGRMAFRLKPGETQEAIEMGRMETRQAILITITLMNRKVDGEEAIAVWDRVYRPTVFFVGESDDYNVYDYVQLSVAVYGIQLDLDTLEDEKKLDTLINRAMTLRSPKIVSTVVYPDEDPTLVTRGLRFMGQRFVPDSYIFQELVFDKVGDTNNPRLFPKGLDVPSVLGSERAYDILLNVYDEGRYANYDEQTEKLRQEFASLPDEQWTENLYWNWLHSLRPLLEVKGEGYPVFMQNQAWVDKDLNTFLGSWTELRHDTILYAKQSYTLKAVAAPPTEEARGYVEPQPEVYGRLAALARQMRDGLDQRGLLNDELRGKTQDLEELLLALKTISEKELANQPLSDEEYSLIRSIGAQLEGITTFSAELTGELASQTDEQMAIVADVHTDTNSGQVLEEGVGDAFTIYAIVPIEGQAILTQGGVFSYYEFLQPMSERMTDESWQAMSPKPDWPVWAASFIK
ncbi:MAG: DUF3160 domain-containing protein [Chloroflexota bacterium]|nr:DUF3160 domain-containing protein [Chloroflexota bacterium]